jgi:hypothetical protein
MKLVPIVYELVEVTAAALIALQSGAVQRIRKGSTKKFEAVREVVKDTVD